MKSVLLFLLGASLFSLLATPLHAQTLQFTDITSGFSVSVPTSSPVTAVRDTSYDTATVSSYRFGIALLPGSGSNSFTVTFPSILTILPSVAACGLINVGLSLSSSVSQCNYTVSWTVPFSGVLTVSLDTADAAGARALSISTFFTNPVPVSSSSSSLAASVSSSPRSLSSSTSPVPSSSAAATSTPAASSSPAAVSSSRAVSSSAAATSAAITPSSSAASPAVSSSAVRVSSSAAPVASSSAAVAATSAATTAVAFGPVMYSDYTGKFALQIPQSTASEIFAAADPNTYSTVRPGAYRFGVKMLPGTASSRFTITYPSSFLTLATNTSGCQLTGDGVLLSSTVPECNFTTSWTAAFSGLLTVTVDSLANSGSLQALSISTFFTPNNATLDTDPIGSLCILSYAAAGNVDYPWSVATKLILHYGSTLITNNEGLIAVQLLGATGTRTFTNRFGASSSTSVNLADDGSNSAYLLYLNAPLPLDTAGLRFNVSSAVQLPGNGPVQLFSQLSLKSVSGVVAEVGASQVDGGSQAFLSDIPGFVNVTLSAGDLNALAPNYDACQAPITFTNGLRAPIQPSDSNGAVQFPYSYFISDGQHVQRAGQPNHHHLIPVRLHQGQFGQSVPDHHRCDRAPACTPTWWMGLH